MSFKLYQIFLFNNPWNFFVFGFVFALMSGKSEKSKNIQKQNSVVQKYLEKFHPWKQWQLILTVNIPNIE